MNILLVLISFLLASLGAQTNLQGNQKDTQLRSTMSMMSTSIVEYQVNNSGKLPSEDDLKSCEFFQPRSSSRECEYELITAGPDQEGAIKTTVGVTCAGKTTPRSFSISSILNSGERSCTDS